MTLTRTLRHSTIITLLCCLVSATVSAQSNAIPPQGAQFLRSSFNRNAIQEATVAYSKSLPGGCADIRFDTQFTVLPFAPLQFSSDGKTLTSGIWKEQVRGTACGAPRIFNILSTVRGDGIVRSPLFIGTTRADPLLQRDASVQATVAAGVQGPPNCKDIWIIDTSFIDHTGPAQIQGAPGKDMRPWEEKWTVHVCNAQVVVVMKFVPDEKGTRISTTINPRSR